MKKLNSWFKVCAVALFAVALIFGCRKIENSYTPENEAAQIKNWLDTQVKNNINIDTTATGLYYIVNKIGSGATVRAGDEVTVQYTGTFINGTFFDASASPGYTYIHKANESRMIPGWEEGIEVMGKGGSAVFLIPSSKAYGNLGQGPIPPYTPLLFTIEVIDIK